MSYELDGFGHVNNAVYLQYLEGARMDYMRQRGLAYADFRRWRLFPVVVSARLDFRHPALADDELLISAWIASCGATKFSLVYEMTRPADGRSILAAETVHVFVDEKGRPQRLPGEFFEKFISGR